MSEPIAPHSQDGPSQQPGPDTPPPALGLAGRLAAAFVDSKLTPLLVLAALLLGLLAIAVTPREEEPQIVVPMIDVAIPYATGSAEEVENHVVKPLERRIAEVEGVEYVYSIAQAGQALVTARFYVGTPTEDALIRLHAKLQASQDVLPVGAGQPQVRPRSIDDVPILALTLSSDHLDDHALRRVAATLQNEVKQIAQVGETTVIGGRPRTLSIYLEPGRLAAYGLAPSQIVNALQAANLSVEGGAFRSGGRVTVVRLGDTLHTRQALTRLVVGGTRAAPVRLGDVATLTDGPAEVSHYVLHGWGPGAEKGSPEGLRPAVTLAIAKQKGANAVTIAARIIDKVHDLQARVLPHGVRIDVTRNYGESAAAKAHELIEHLLIATIAVVLLIGVALGIREAFVVGVAVPVTLAFALFLSMAYGYSLNRVTLFALIFAIGILVDDAIVVVENIHRWLGRPGLSTSEAVVQAVDEVGNPTILATVAVIAVLVPMALVGGLMGPYMAPIPINASVAMAFSLVVAFVVTPWFAVRYLRAGEPHAETATPQGGIAALYARTLRRLLVDRRARRKVAFGIAALLLGAGGLVAGRGVYLKMLPFDNKNEFQLLVDMPRGTSLERTTQVARALGRYLVTVNEVRDIQIYAGAAAPITFNGLVRHYDHRGGDASADIQVNLVDKGARVQQSHDLARQLRGPLQAIAAPYGANLKVIEVPPGPPVLSPLVAEVYGPDFQTRQALAKQVLAAFRAAPEVVDADIYLEAPQTEWRIKLGEKARLAGLNEAQVISEVGTLVAGRVAGLLHDADELEAVPIVVRAPEAKRNPQNLSALRLPGFGPERALVPLGEVTQAETGEVAASRHAKNLQPVVYVVADVMGRSESPVYGMLALRSAIANIKAPDGRPLEQHSVAQPWITDHPALKWDGEWQVTYEVFRDLGLAFAGGLVVIYLLIVGWFQSFRLPLVIMSPIPLTLVGVLPGHWLFGAFFTATSMIGAIALAGIIVRNSILLVEFARAREAEGVPTHEAVVEAGLVRARPIFLTAAAVMVGALVILFDPIFSGLAISLIFGTLAATLLTLLVVPLLYALLAEAPSASLDDSLREPHPESRSPVGGL